MTPARVPGLRQAQTMQAVGERVGAIAHDFNNLLTAILGFAEMTHSQLPAGQMRDDVQQILDAGQSASLLTEQLLALSRASAPGAHDSDVPPSLLDEPAGAAVGNHGRSGQT